MKNEVGFHVPVRPMPPEWIFEMGTPNFVPAPEMWDWIGRVFLNPKSKLFNLDHLHLRSFRYPDIAVMWARSGFKKQGRQVIGTTEKVMINAGGWKKERQEEQFIQWFEYVPEYLITLDASYSRIASDVNFCALVEHELYHIAHMKDKYGTPAFNRETGMPKLAIQGHDVEEFTGVVRRYGASEDVMRMVEAANKRPQLSRADVHYACGTCNLKVV
ncbi:putative metallopeptidase [Acinetobacter pittii]|uniref:putative metallopeptidase n=1 Tax=Acinetobacter pittii TaxID=48296 RepID=UPI0021CDDC73|nr:putative metallopeptidase [Acinetobacter pittii]MCU4333814.1 transposase [Acinetobacter pittii]